MFFSPTVLSKKAENFPGNRELVSIIRCGHGDVSLYMPTMRDMRNLSANDPDFFSKAAALSTGMSHADFLDLSYVDGSAIIHRLSDALSILYPADMG